MQDLVYRFEPSVAVFADSDGGIARARSVAEAAGAHVASAGGVRAGVVSVGDTAVDAVLIDVTRDGGAELDALLGGVQAAAAAGRLHGLVTIPPSLIDVATTRLCHENVTIVCQGNEAEGVAALALALTPRDQLVLEERGDDSSMQLRRVREEVARLARALATVAGGAEERLSTALAEPEIVPGAIIEQPAAGVLRGLLRARRLRDQYFDPELFADPAWDMLLDLMLARLERRSVAVSSLCIAAAVPPTTALRWIKRLTEEGLFVRVADPLDGRRIFIELADSCATAMMRYLKASARVTGAE